MSATPFFVIRNSVHNDLSGLLNDEKEINFEKQSDNVDEEYDGLVKQSCVSVVRLLETPSEGLFRLDFSDSGIDNASLVDKVLRGESVESKEVYIAARSWQHLYTFAALIGKEERFRPTYEQYNLLSSEYGVASFFTLLKDDLVDVLSDQLSLNRLFSWKVLVSAKTQGDLNWKHIRSFLSKTREEVPFLTKNGVLKSNEPTQLSFLQFVVFSKLLENHMNTLPDVVCKVLTTTATSVSIQLKSSHNCSIQIGAVTDNMQPPSSQDLQHNSKIFAYWKSLQVNAGYREKIKIDSLQPNTAYKSFLRVVRGAVASDNDCVLRSKFEFVTDCQPNVFPDFESMSPEEKRIEASSQDHGAAELIYILSYLMHFII